MLIKRIRKWFGFGSTLVFIIGAIAPSQLSIPLAWRPWIFLAAILWFFLFSTGFFNG